VGRVAIGAKRVSTGRDALPRDPAWRVNEDWIAKWDEDSTSRVETWLKLGPADWTYPQITQITQIF
jgi:hypothetical protein